MITLKILFGTAFVALCVLLAIGALWLLACYENAKEYDEERGYRKEDDKP